MYQQSRPSAPCPSSLHDSASKSSHGDKWIILLIYTAFLFALMQVFFPFILILIVALSIILRAELMPKWVSRLLAGSVVAAFLLTYTFLYYYRNSHMNFAAALKDGPMTARSVGSALCFGLVSGMMTYGEVTTSVFFVKTYAVTVGSWLSTTQFLNALSVAYLCPGPSVVYVVFIGSQGCGAIGGLLMLFGMLVPNLLSMAIRIDRLEKAVLNRTVRTSLEGWTLGLLGLLSLTVFQLMRFTFVNAFAIFSSCVCLAVLLMCGESEGRIIPLLLLGTALAGQVFYV